MKKNEAIHKEELDNKVFIKKIYYIISKSAKENMFIL